MSHLLTPRKNDRALTETNSDSNIIISPHAQTPTSHKKKSRYEDILYISKSELEKEVKAFILLLASRNSIKDTEISSYIDYLKKGIINIAVDSSQIENIENFSDVTRSPGHRKTPSSSYVGEHHLKLRNFQLERDRIAYEDKIMNHGKHIADLEQKISKLIEEYKGVFDEKTAVEAEVENLNKQLSISKSLNSALKTNNEGILKKNSSMRTEIESLLKKIAELEAKTPNEANHALNIEKLQARITDLEVQVQSKENDLKTQVSVYEAKQKGMEEQAKKEIEEKEKRILALEETTRKDAAIKRKNEVLQKQISELEEQIKLDAGLKMKVCAFQQQITVLEEHIKRDVGLRVENENQQKKIQELEECIKVSNGQRKDTDNRREPTLENEQSKKSADYIREIKNLKAQVVELKEQAKKDARLRSEFLAMQKLISELEERMKAAVDQKKEIESQKFRIFELEAQIKKDVELKRDIEAQQIRIFELEAQMKREAELKNKVELEAQLENEKLDRYAKVLEDMERVKLENEKLAGQLTERESNIKMLENQKEKLLKEIGGLIDNIRKEDEEDEKGHQGTDKLIFQNAHLAKEVREKDALIKVLKGEIDSIKQEAQEYKRILRISGVEELANKAYRRDQPFQQNHEGNGVPSNDNKVERKLVYPMEEAQNPGGSKSILLLENFESQGTDRIQESYDRILPKGDILQYEDLSQLYGSMTHDHMKKQVDDYRTANILLQKKVESYYLQIEELNTVLKISNENLDAAQNRCITLQRELQNKCNLEALVQSLLTLINNLEQKIERLVEENMSLQKTAQNNVIVITNLKNQLKEGTQKQPKGRETEQDQSSDAKYKGLSNLEREALVKEYEEKIKMLIEEKGVELEEEKIRNKNHIDRYHAHLEVLGRKVQALVSVNEGLGRDLEVLKVEFADYKIVVASIIQEAIKSLEGLKNFDPEMQNIIQSIFEEKDKSEEAVRLKEFYGMLRRDVSEAKKLLEERKSLL